MLASLLRLGITRHSGAILNTVANCTGADSALVAAKRNRREIFEADDLLGRILNLEGQQRALADVEGELRGLAGCERHVSGSLDPLARPEIGGIRAIRAKVVNASIVYRSVPPLVPSGNGKLVPNGLIISAGVSTGPDGSFTIGNLPPAN